MIKNIFKERSADWYAKASENNYRAFLGITLGGSALLCAGVGLSFVSDQFSQVFFSGAMTPLMTYGFGAVVIYNFGQYVRRQLKAEDIANRKLNL